MFPLATTLAWLRDRPREMFVALALALALAFTITPVGAVFADDAAGVVVEDVNALVLTPVYVTIITGLVMPFVIGLINRFIQTASSQTKGFVALLIAAVVAFVERAILVDGSARFTWALLLDVGLVYVPQLATYLGVWSRPDSSGRTLNQKLAGGG